MVPYSTPVPLDRHVRFPLTESAPPANCGPGVADGHNRPLELPVVGVQFGGLRLPMRALEHDRRGAAYPGPVPGRFIGVDLPAQGWVAARGEPLGIVQTRDLLRERVEE